MQLLSRVRQWLSESADHSTQFLITSTEERACFNSLSNGDIVLFSYRGASIISLLVKLLTRSHFTHIGVVLEREGVGYKEIIEAIYEHGRFVQPQVKLRRLDDKLENYQGDVYVRRLFVARDSQFEQRLNKAVQELVGRPFEGQPMQLLTCVFWALQRQTNERVFCSELVAIIYQKLGLISTHVSPARFTPGHFSQSMYLRHSALGQPMRVKTYGGSVGKELLGFLYGVCACLALWFNF